MAFLKIHHEKITPEAAAILCGLCPFSSITYSGGRLAVDEGCRMCGVCADEGPDGAVTLEAEAGPDEGKSEWNGIAVFAECLNGAVHPVAMELVGKAKELAGVTGQPVYALLIGGGIGAGGAADGLLRCGADAAFIYDYPELSGFHIEPYANAFSDFIEKVKPSAVLVGATNIGRSLAPRVAARFRTGLTADCTMLEMRDNSDLLQIRPAFGGNIMARIVTPRHRPQFCTVRYKVFAAANPAGDSRAFASDGDKPAAHTGDKPAANAGDKPLHTGVRFMTLPADKLNSAVVILDIKEKPAQIDISDAKVIVAAGRGFKRKEDLHIAEELAALLGAQLACTRPLIEAGWFDPRRQIGLSGRTVGADLIIACGVSGSVQFAAGMRGCKCIIAVNEDPNAPIFNIANYAAVGDIYEVLPKLINMLKNAEEGGPARGLEEIINGKRLV